RALVWNAAWDMTRDAEWPARAFVDLVLGNVGAESDSSVVLVLLRQLQTATDSYVAPEHRVATKRSVADRLWTLVEAAQEGSDTQLQLLKAFAVHATTAPQLDVVAGLADGSRTVAGLPVDTDLRWELLTSLAAGGRAGEAEITAHLATDDTANGRQAAASARAAIATPEAKAAAWDAMVTREGMPNAILETSLLGFNRTHEDALLEPFVEPYFASLETVWTTRGNDMAQDLVQLLYPTALASRPELDVLGRTDAFLAALGDRHPGLRRMLLEVKDGAERALRVQAADRAAG
ncbi:MAG: aminopeptidase N, partial [Actinomycetales bacterium]|nr:aminopeptidase N [Actinomycetales bacterium]